MQLVSCNKHGVKGTSNTRTLITKGPWKLTTIHSLLSQGWIHHISCFRSKASSLKVSETKLLPSCTASYNAWANRYCHYYYLAPSESPGIGALPMTGDTRVTEPEESYHKSWCHFENSKKQTTHYIIEQEDEQISPSPWISVWSALDKQKADRAIPRAQRATDRKQVNKINHTLSTG